MAARSVAEGHKPVSRRVMAIMAGIGVVVASIGISIGIKAWLFEASAREAEGTVIRMNRHLSRGKVSYSPVVSYEINGKSFQLRSDVATSPPAFRVGEKVTVLYRAGHPADGQIKSFSEQWVLPLIVTGLGTVVAGVGIWHLFRGIPSS
jgi:hypothetical protein